MSSSCCRRSDRRRRAGLPPALQRGGARLPLNHARIDYLMARAERGGSLARESLGAPALRRDVYGLYGAALIVPPLVLLLFR